MSDDTDINKKQSSPENKPKAAPKAKAAPRKTGKSRVSPQKEDTASKKTTPPATLNSDKTAEKKPQKKRRPAPRAKKKQDQAAPAKKEQRPLVQEKTEPSQTPQEKKITTQEKTAQKPRAKKGPSRPAKKTSPAASAKDSEKASTKATPNPKQQPPKAKVLAPSSTEKHGFKLLINADEPEECRVALLDHGKLESFHLETVVSVKTKGNIYKAKVVTVEQNLQAIFVDIGTGKNAFLPFSEVHPEYYAREEDIDKHWKDVNIREAIKEGQELLVEVVKETTGNKGANVTTFLSLPGRYLVLMPGSSSHGISRKIEDETQRKKLRDMLASCNLPEGVGYIIRTASSDITKTALTKDVRFLINLWKEIKERGQTQPAPSLVYQEQDIIARFLRDHFSPEIQEILVDSKEAYDQVVNFLDLLPAAQKKKTTARLHKGPRPLLNSFNVEEQIEQIYHPTVKLPSGGSIVINPTEALVAIDVNSGRTDKENNFEKTIFQANMEAAEELARQLRLRDLGGLIVVDFIDMRVAAHTREVEKSSKTA